MNTDRLSFKDYVLIYFIIFLVVVFLGGFFLGAQVMENKLTSAQASLKKNKEVSSEAEITKFYNKIYLPVYTYNKDVFNRMKSNHELKQNEISLLTDTGNIIESNLNMYTYQSPYLKLSLTHLKGTIQSLLSTVGQKNNDELINKAFDQFLNGQKSFYQAIWIWEQSTKTNITSLNTESQTDWIEWEKADLHQKDYIVASILLKKSIHTFLKPEDITGHIDSYIKENKKVILELEDMVNLLIKSDSIQDKDFSKYKHWYNNVPYPNILNFN